MARGLFATRRFVRLVLLGLTLAFGLAATGCGDSTGPAVQHSEKTPSSRLPRR
jgi:hypothetical protein